MKREKLFTFSHNGKSYQVELSAHAQKRMRERGITEEQVAHNLLSITLDEFNHLSKHSLEAMIMDERKEVNIVISFRKTKIRVITVIKKKNPYAKKNTIVMSV